MGGYNPREIEPKWQKFWEERRLYRTPDFPQKPKYYVLEMFPYPSGGDLHMGHLKNYTIGDVVARLKKMEGFEVLHPMGWDAFGLPAENAAIQFGVHPREWTYNNIATFKHHLKLVGLSYDWDREIATCDPEYYRWTQWLFLYLYHRGLAYRKTDFVNYCPSCKTVLANEQVLENGTCERCKTPVERRELEQWFFKITAYAERLLKDLEKLRGKWPESVIRQQENWIGKSEGTEIHFLVEYPEVRLPVFTTRADTLFGVTFITIAPEHPLLQELLPAMPSEHRRKVEAYIQEALNKSERERTEKREKTGVFTGLYARHPYLETPIPIWVGDYVLAGYGTGVVMGVPAHDQRDFEFARKHRLPIRVVIRPVDGEVPDPEEMTEAFEEKGVMVNSGPFTGLSSEEGIRAIQEDLQKRGLGGPTVSYRLRDWLISRQRYWGAPIPMIHCPRCGIVPVPEEDLPVLLPPNVENYKPTGRSPLEDIPEFMETRCPRCQGPARRDPDTMDTFVDSSWYFLRFIDPKNPQVPFDVEKVRAWMPVDQYIGGAEHATKHLIYARFITKVLFDGGLVPVDEPFDHLFTQGLVLKGFHHCPVCLRVVGETEVFEENGQTFHRAGEEKHALEWRVGMMSKSRGNIEPVGAFVRQYGADVARVAILFAAPPEKDFEWTGGVVEGARSFIQRVWRLYEDYLPQNPPTETPAEVQGEERKLLIALHQTIAGVRQDLVRFSFNTAIAKLMTLLNELYDTPIKDSPVFAHVLYRFVLLLAPFVPHLAEELWHRMGFEDSVFEHAYPEADPRYTVADEVEIPVQVNGKLRAVIRLPRGVDREAVLQAAREDGRVARHLEGQEIVKVVYVPGRLVNFVVKDAT